MELLTRPLQDQEATRLNSEIPQNFSDYFSFKKDQTVCDGPLSFEELKLEKSMIVIGDVSCKKTLSVPQGRSLIITGTLTAGAIIAVGKIIILGDLQAGDVYGDSFCNEVFCCRGDAKVRCLIEKGHDFQFMGDLDGKCVASISNVVSIAKNKKVEKLYLGGIDDQKRREIFVPEIFDSNGSLKSDLAVRRILDEKPLLQKISD